MRIAIYLTLLAICVVYALSRGGAPERWGAAVLGGIVAIDPLVHQFIPVRYLSVDLGHLSIDAAGLLALGAIALRANRYWPLWLSALQTITVMSHVAKLIDVGIHPVAYAGMQVVWSYLMILGLALGVRAHQRRLRRNGADQSWSNFSSP